ncbi:hypothetical protein AB0D91_32245 [Streptomyces canus]|uniref:hypothetical protein n=1 Tax=Streptomyces canus TaxID=58343 RepID=UPI0033DED0CC
MTEVPEPPPMLLPPAELPRTQIIERPRHRHEDIHRLLEKRWTISAIARRLNLDAVTVGLTLPWSSGVVEGHVNRVKTLKRACTAEPRSDSSGHAFSPGHDLRYQSTGFRQRPRHYDSGRE